MAAKRKTDRTLIGMLGGMANGLKPIDERRQHTAPARAALDAKRAAEIDPDGTMDPAELKLLVARRRRADMVRMSLLAVQARQAKREAALAAELEALEAAD